MSRSTKNMLTVAMIAIVVSAVVVWTSNNVAAVNGEFNLQLPA